MSDRLIITVVGGSEATPEALAMAGQVGQELAQRGITVACGGLSGVMEAVCRGAKAAGGTTIGILPGRDPRDANPYVDIPICTSMGYARNVVVVHTGRAVIAVDGAYGTLSEIAHALAEDIPVIGLDTWSMAQNGQQDSRIIIASDAVDAVKKAVAAARQRDANPSTGQGRP